MNTIKINKYRLDKWGWEKTLSGRLDFYNNYPIHHYLPEWLWNAYKKIICSVGPECVICMATRWAIIGFVLGKLM